jgi:hypothetical protein
MSTRDGSRIQIDSEEFNPRPLRPQPLTPRAEPVDTFSRPNAGAQMSQLAQALAGVAPSLSRFSDVQFDKETAANKEEATVSASKAHEQRLQYADAVKKGVIKANDNPYFQLYYKQQSGALAAGDYGSALKAEMETNPAFTESTDPKDFYKLEGDFKKQWVKDNVGDRGQDPHFGAVFQKIVDGISQDSANRFAEQAGARMMLHAGEQLNQLQNQTIDRSFENHESRPALVMQLNAINDRYLKDNPNSGNIVNNQMTKALQDYALLHPEQAEAVFDLAKDIHTGPGGTLDKVHTFRAMVEETRTKITVAQSETMRLQGMKEQEHDKKVERDFWSDATTALTKATNPATVDLGPFIQRATNDKFGNSQEVTRSLYALREALSQKDAPGNDDTFRRAMLRVYGLDHERPGQLLSMDQLASYASLGTGMRLSNTQFLELQSRIQERDRQADEGKAMKQMRVLSNPMFTQAAKKLTDAIMDPALPTHMQQVRSGQALEELTMRYLQGLDQFDAAGDPDKQQKLMDNMLHGVAQLYAPDFARSAAQETAGLVREQERKQGIYHTVISRISTPDDKRQMENIIGEVDDINERPYDDNKKPRTLSESTIQFLFNHGMGTLYKKGQKIDLDDINDFLTEYRRANNLR